MGSPQLLPVNPLSKIYLVDDFISGAPTGGGLGSLGWNLGSTGAGAAGASGNLVNPNTLNQGVLMLATGTTATGRTSLMLAAAVGAGTMKPYAGSLRQTWYVQVPTLSSGTERYALRMGFGDSITADYANGIYFEYDDSASANWRCKTASASTRTTVDSGVAVAAGTWVKLEIFTTNAATSFSFAINGTTVATISSNMPTTDVSPNMHIIKSIGTTSRLAYIDYFVLAMTLSGTR